ncbi:MAG: CDP-alcohol phosphatidyltransferase family protein, partial [Thermodesulfobacteriota bacterium]
MNLPNILTLIRVLLIPVFVILIMNKFFGWAIITFASAGITDGIDGLIARITQQRTELGAYLDPIADKLLLSSGFITLAIIEMLPSWLAVIVITRDLIILIGLLGMILINYHPRIRPSLVSKVTTVLQIVTILLALLVRYYPTLGRLSTIAIYGTAL